MSLNYQTYIENHPIEATEAALKTTMAIQASELNAGGPNYTRTLAIPKIFSQADKKRFEQIVTTFYQIFTKVIQAYKQDETIRRLYPFSKSLEELILLEPDYATLIPICRIDIFYNEQTKDFKVCEFNTDGTSAMNENARLDGFLALNPAYLADTTAYEHMELVDKWVDALVRIASKPIGHLAIVDFLDRAYLSEFYVFQKRFERAGISCEVVDIRDLVLQEQQLVSKQTGKPIDVIYRRAVTKDVQECMEQVTDFIEAVKQGFVQIIGPFHTQLIHHKQINHVLRNEHMMTYFTPEEKAFIKAHLPETHDLVSGIQINWQDKDRWIIKPKDGYASKGVYTGVDVNQKQWVELVNHHMDQDYLIQEYIRPYPMMNIDLVDRKEWLPYSNLTGLYAYGGRFAGVYSRLSDAGIISTQYNEKTIPTLFTLD